MIKAVIFDFGNVIRNYTNDHFLNKLSAINSKDKSENFELIYNVSKLPDKYETGLISSTEFFEEISKLCGLSISYEELREIYTKGKFTPVPGMDGVIKSLKGKYKLALLSNTSEWDTKFGIDLVPEIKLFNVRSLSYEVGAMKPSPKIYFDALAKLDLAPQECVYIDDILDFVKTAIQIGIKGIHFTDINSLESDLKEYAL